jgi:hypothetical protein
MARVFYSFLMMSIARGTQGGRRALLARPQRQRGSGPVVSREGAVAPLRLLARRRRRRPVAGVGTFFFHVHPSFDRPAPPPLPSFVVRAGLPGGWGAGSTGGDSVVTGRALSGEETKNRKEKQPRKIVKKSCFTVSRARRGGAREVHHKSRSSQSVSTLRARGRGGGGGRAFPSFIFWSGPALLPGGGAREGRPAAGGWPGRGPRAMRRGKGSATAGSATAFRSVATPSIAAAAAAAAAAAGAT